MINSPDPSAVASRITLAPRYFLSGWGSGRSLYSSIAGRCLLGIFQPSPVASRAVVSAIPNPPCPQFPVYPIRMLFKRLSHVNKQRSIYMPAQRDAIFEFTRATTRPSHCATRGSEEVWVVDSLIKCASVLVHGLRATLLTKICGRLAQE